MGDTWRPKGSYGLDAPWVPWLWLGLAVLYAALAVLAPTVWGGPWWVGLILGVLSLGFLAGALLYLHATLRGKFFVWAWILDRLPVEGTRHALDLGCGHGAVAIRVAQRFPGVSVDGLDLWRSIDQSGNSPEATRRNAALNGVQDRLSLTTGDMTAVPYPDGAFDLVTASLAIHNIPAAEGRARAIREAWRVLADGGALIIVDIYRTAEYARILRDLGASVEPPRGLGWRMWWTGPWVPTRLVHAVKNADQPTNAR